MIEKHKRAGNTGEKAGGRNPEAAVRDRAATRRAASEARQKDIGPESGSNGLCVVQSLTNGQGARTVPGTVHHQEPGDIRSFPANAAYRGDSGAGDQKITASLQITDTVLSRPYTALSGSQVMLNRTRSFFFAAAS